MIGHTLGHYRIQGQLGAGGMGVVYRAYDTKLERSVAVKVLSERMVGEPTARERFLREAKTASALNHPHICTLHEVGEADGQLYLVMEHVEGRPLTALLSEARPTETVVRYGIQIADALAHAHGRGIVHRDLKANNVMVTPEGRAKILDFGLAKRLPTEDLAEQPTRSEDPLTEAGMVVGTLHYLAPEILRGQTADTGTDIWALGVLLYELAIGHLPFRGRTRYEVTHAILGEPPEPLPKKVPPGLRAVIQRCLAKEQGQRYRHASEVRAALEAIEPGSFMVGEAPGPRSPSRRWFLWVTVGTLALLWGSVATRFFDGAVRSIGSTTAPHSTTVGMPPNTGSIQIVRTDPPRGSVLHRRETVKLVVTVRYSLQAAEHGSVVLVVQDQAGNLLRLSPSVDARPELAPHFRQAEVATSKGSGEVTLEGSFVVPGEATFIDVYVPLNAVGQSSTSTVDSLRYAVE